MSRVLDMGSGLVTDIRATDAIEGSTDKVFLKGEEKWMIEGQAIHLGVSKEKIKKLQDYRNSHTKIIFGVNYNIHVPYIDNTFSLVVSNSSMAKFGKLKAYSEAQRVLKKGGTLEISGAKLSKADITHITNNMIKCGFKNIVFMPNKQDTRLFFSNTHFMRKDVVRGVK